MSKDSYVVINFIYCMMHLFSNSLSPLAATFVVMLFFGFGCSTTSKMDPGSPSTDSTASVDYDEMEELYWERVQQQRMSFTEADIQFMNGMIAHHAQALIMSRLAPENGANPEIQRLAARIINSQRDEIESMQTWLERRNQPVPQVHIDGLNLMVLTPGGSHQHDHSKMAGMLTDEELQELSNAKNEAFDRLFLQYMISHHQGAVQMVDKLVSTDGAAQDEEAFRLAADINADQMTEIERMQKMLDDLRSNN